MGPDEEDLNEETFREEPVIEAAMIECNTAAVVVEGPGCDPKFLSEWVAAAAKVQAAWDVASEGPDGELYNGVLYGELIHFGLWAIDFISRLREGQTCRRRCFAFCRVRGAALLYAHGGAGVL